MDRYQYPKEEQKLLESLRQPFAVYQIVDGKIEAVVISDGFCELFGYISRDKANYDMNHEMYRDIHEDDARRMSDAAIRFARDGTDYDVIYRAKPKNSFDYHIIHAQGRHVFTPEGIRLAHVWYTDEGIYREKSEGQDHSLNFTLSNMMREENINTAGHYDYLTGLPGMTYFFELASAAKNSAEEAGEIPVMLYLDLSGMKYYNYRYGFGEGNKLLIEFSKLLSRTFGPDHCSHLGHGHFTAISTEEGLEDTLDMFFEEAGCLNGGNSLPVKVGIYTRRMDDIPPSSACDRAKLACDSLKGIYASAYRYYEPQMSEKAERRQYILENFDRAIKEKWIQVYYQPIIRAVNGRVCDEEALARWIDPIRGILSPAEFIPALEDSGLIYRLDLYVLEQVLLKYADMRERNLTIVPHSINLSRSDFDSCDMVEEIRRRVDEAGVSHDKITIEITESVIGRDVTFIKAQVERFQSLGFPVWMDDFGSGYSSLDVLQTIKFNLIKFDMSFMRKLDEGDSGKIILTELMKMAAALGVDTVCEGVEKESQMQFLQEIGCSKLQGYYYCKPIPLSELIRRYDTGKQIGFENPNEEAYYQDMGRLNLYDLGMIAPNEGDELRSFFNTLPMGVLEVHKDTIRIARSNPSYRDFVKRYFNVDLSERGTRFTRYTKGFFTNLIRKCAEEGGRTFYDEQLSDGSVVHTFARRIGVNPVNGNIAVAVVVLSISPREAGTTYAEIARALASDYYNIYYIDLENGKFIEYTSAVGQQDMAMERHGENFFEAVRRDSAIRIYEEDLEMFLRSFTKENIIRELDEQGVFTLTYRLIDSGKPMYANMKITRMPDGRHIIMGISIIDSQMKQKEMIESVQKERDALIKIMAISDNYLSLYSINPRNGKYIEYSATDEYSQLGLAKQGEDFFRQVIIDGRKVVSPEDQPKLEKVLTMENIMKQIREKGSLQVQYRLMFHGEPKPVSLRIAMVKESDGEKLIAGVRAWTVRKKTETGRQTL